MKRKAEGESEVTVDKKRKLAQRQRLSERNECMQDGLIGIFPDGVMEIILGYSSYVDGTCVQTLSISSSDIDLVDMYGEHIYMLHQKPQLCLQSYNFSDGAKRNVICFKKPVHYMDPLTGEPTGWWLMASDSRHICVIQGAYNRTNCDVSLVDRKDFDNGCVDEMRWTSFHLKNCHDYLITACLSGDRINFLIRDGLRQTCDVQYIAVAGIHDSLQATLTTYHDLPKYREHENDYLTDFWLDSDCTSALFTRCEEGYMTERKDTFTSVCQVIQHGNQMFRVLKMSGQCTILCCLQQRNEWKEFASFRPPPFDDALDQANNWEPYGMKCIERSGINQLVVYDTCMQGKIRFYVFQ